MKTKRKVATLAATLITFGSLAGGANAAILITLSESSGNVVVTTTGSLSEDAFVFQNSPGTPSFSNSNLRSNALSSVNVGFQFDMYLAQSVSGTWIPFTNSISLAPNPTVVNTGFEVFQGAGQVFRPLGTTGDLVIPAQSTAGNTAIFSIIGASLTDFLSGADAQIGNSWSRTFTSNGISDSITFAVIPEPSAAILLGLGSLSLAAFRRSRR